VQETEAEAVRHSGRALGDPSKGNRTLPRQNLALPNVVVETRSVMALKSLIGHSGFLGWMPAPMYDAERKAGLIDALDIPGASDRRTLTAFRRRAGGDDRAQVSLAMPFGHHQGHFIHRAPG
jgi:DNA-binding transcriptional LysR family regulator